MPSVSQFLFVHPDQNAVNGLYAPTRGCRGRIDATGESPSDGGQFHLPRGGQLSAAVNNEQNAALAPAAYGLGARNTLTPLDRPNIDLSVVPASNTWSMSLWSLSRSKPGRDDSFAPLEDGEGSTFGVVEDSDTSHVEQVEGLHGDRAPQLGRPGGGEVRIRDGEIDHPMRRDVLRPQLVHLHHAGDRPLDTREEEAGVARSLSVGRAHRFPAEH